MLVEMNVPSITSKVQVRSTFKNTDVDRQLIKTGESFS